MQTGNEIVKGVSPRHARHLAARSAELGARLETLTGLAFELRDRSLLQPVDRAPLLVLAPERRRRKLRYHLFRLSGRFDPTTVAVEYSRLLSYHDYGQPACVNSRAPFVLDPRCNRRSKQDHPADGSLLAEAMELDQAMCRESTRQHELPMLPTTPAMLVGYKDWRRATYHPGARLLQRAEKDGRTPPETWEALFSPPGTDSNPTENWLIPAEYLATGAGYVQAYFDFSAMAWRRERPVASLPAPSWANPANGVARDAGLPRNALQQLSDAVHHGKPWPAAPDGSDPMTYWDAQCAALSDAVRAKLGRDAAFFSQEAVYEGLLHPQQPLYPDIPVEQVPAEDRRRLLDGALALADPYMAACRYEEELGAAADGWAVSGEAVMAVTAMTVPQVLRRLRGELHDTIRFSAGPGGCRISVPEVGLCRRQGREKRGGTPAKARSPKAAEPQVTLASLCASREVPSS